MGGASELVIFDLFDTILDKVWFDYDKALDYLYTRYLTGISRDELNDWAKEYRRLHMMDRNETHRESSFINQLAFYEDKSGIRHTEDYKTIEWDTFRICREERIGNHASEILEHLKANGHPLAILSNSIFSSECLTRYLGSFGLSKYFDRVYSSADMGIRKPSVSAFHRVCEGFGVNPSDTWFVGNNREKDVQGAMNAGLKAVYYDRSGEGYDGFRITDLIELKQIIR